MTTQAELVAEGRGEQRSIFGMLGAWLSSRDLRALLLAFGAALLVFSGLLVLLGKDPITVFVTIYQGTLGDSYGWGEIVVKMTPFILCALATAIPARVGLVNVGGEGQIYMGAWLATWVALNVGGLPGPILIPVLILAGCLGGALWAGLVGWLRANYSLNETIASLLLNYVASLIIDF